MVKITYLKKLSPLKVPLVFQPKNALQLLKRNSCVSKLNYDVCTTGESELDEKISPATNSEFLSEKYENTIVLGETLVHNAKNALELLKSVSSRLIKILNVDASDYEDAKNIVKKLTKLQRDVQMCMEKLVRTSSLSVLYGKQASDSDTKQMLFVGLEDKKYNFGNEQEKPCFPFSNDVVSRAESEYSNLLPWIIDVSNITILAAFTAGIMMSIIKDNLDLIYSVSNFSDELVQVIVYLNETNRHLSQLPELVNLTNRLIFNQGFYKYRYLFSGNRISIIDISYTAVNTFSEFINILDTHDCSVLDSVPSLNVALECATASSIALIQSLRPLLNCNISIHADSSSIWNVDNMCYLHSPDESDNSDFKLGTSCSSDVGIVDTHRASLVEATTLFVTALLKVIYISESHDFLSLSAIETLSELKSLARMLLHATNTLKHSLRPQSCISVPPITALSYSSNKFQCSSCF